MHLRAAIEHHAHGDYSDVAQTCRKAIEAIGQTGFGRKAPKEVAEFLRVKSPNSTVWRNGPQLCRLRRCCWFILARMREKRRRSGAARTRTLHWHSPQGFCGWLRRGLPIPSRKRKQRHPLHQRRPVAPCEAGSCIVLRHTRRHRPRPSATICSHYTGIR